VVSNLARSISGNLSCRCTCALAAELAGDVEREAYLGTSCYANDELIPLPKQLGTEVEFKFE
jgi:hypothetical protein